MKFDQFISLFPDAKEKPYGSMQFKCKCPAHDDKKASLSIKLDGDTILVYCHAGCTTDQVLAAKGLKLSDIQPDKEPEKLQPWQKNLVAEYRYTDADGNYKYSKLRYEGPEIEGKIIRYGRIINGKYQAGKGDAQSSLYNLTAMQRAIATGKRIYIVEGEKDVETLRKYGMIAVTAGGVADWKSGFADCFIGAAEVVIIADRDDPGQKLAQIISKDLKPVVYSHKVITPSGLQHGDVTDYLTEESGTIEDLMNMVEESSPIYANWITAGKKLSINTDLLAIEILKRNVMFIARNPGTKSDIIFWYSDGVYRPMSEAELSSMVRRWIPIGRATPDSISKVVRMIQYSSEVKPYEMINKDERFINLANGRLDTETGELISHDPELISTLQLNCRFIPSATAPMWEKFINALCFDPETEMVDSEMRDVLQEWTGLVLSTIYGYRVKMALILFSPQGNSGKTVFLSVIGALLGKDAISNVDFKSLGSSRWATGRAFSKRALVVGDEGGERVDSSAIFKQLTGGDTVSAEFKGLQGFDYTFRGVIVAACNVLPYFEDDKGNHVIDRLQLMNCRYTVPPAERDPLLIDKLTQELDGIFQWAWIGLRRFISNGMRFSYCQSSADLTAEYRARYDTMYAFLRDEIVVTHDKHDAMKKTDLEWMYNRYCELQELNPLGKKSISQRLASLGIPLRNRGNIMMYVGVIPKRM